MDLPLKEADDNRFLFCTFASRLKGASKVIVEPPYTSPANFCIRATFTLGLRPVGSGLAITSVTAPPKSEKTTVSSKPITTDGTFVTTRVNAWLTDNSPSLTDNSIATSPAASGVPLIVPVVVSKLAQAGSTLNADLTSGSPSTSVAVKV